MLADSFVTPDNLSEKTAHWLDLIRSRNRTRPDLVLEPSKCALLIVDMLHYFAHPDGRSYLPAADAIIPRISGLLSVWRDIGGTVVFTRHCHRGEDDLGMLGKFFSDYIRCGSRESEIISMLAPSADERVFQKNTYDAFYETGLEEYLKELNIEQVLVTGVLTHLCCETAARSAFVRGFEVYIAADALTSSTEELHIGSLLGLANGFAVVSDTASFCSAGGSRTHLD